mmetsp:Transcript_97904/g.184097  ORF Transcript_97904/g.184097 Transcript_97904/m.184097 type:complete len:233 (-) Transcript_97904:487-1185(-)
MPGSVPGNANGAAAAVCGSEGCVGKGPPELLKRFCRLPCSASKRSATETTGAGSGGAAALAKRLFSSLPEPLSNASRNRSPVVASGPTGGAGETDGASALKSTPSRPPSCDLFALEPSATGKSKSIRPTGAVDLCFASLTTLSPKSAVHCAVVTGPRGAAESAAAVKALGAGAAMTVVVLGAGAVMASSPPAALSAAPFGSKSEPVVTSLSKLLGAPASRSPRRSQAAAAFA